MKKYYSIGEMAKKNYITTHTLRYYDKIGLLKPEYVDEHSGYRYYTHNDFLLLDTIQYLQLFGMSLKEIHEHFSTRSVEKTLALYKKQLPEIEKNIQALRSIKKRMEHNIKNLQNTLELSEDIEHVHYSKRYAILLDEPVSNDEEYEINIRKMSYSLYQGNFRLMGDFIGVKEKENIVTGDYDMVNYIGAMMYGKPKDYHYHIIDAGDYLCAYHKGPAEKIGSTYEKIIEYIKENGYEIAGSVLEIYEIDLMDSADPDEYLTRIEVPII